MASSISVNIHLAHPGHAQNGSIRLSQQDDAKISNFHVCATYTPSPGNYPLSWNFPLTYIGNLSVLDLPVLIDR